MGVRGPAPKPDVIKKLEGNPGKRPLNDKDPFKMSYGETPKPPKKLMKDAKKAWERLAPLMAANGLLTPMTIDYFAEVCQWYARYTVVERKVMEEGDQGVYKTQSSESGYMSQHPLIMQMNQYYDKWEKGIKEFGMTPMSWSRYMSIAGGNQSDADEEDPLEKLLGG